jgi:mannose-6-phosphate isomerase-like protein (cupin superfamily)
MSVTSEHYVVAEDEAEAIWFLGTMATIKASADRTGGALSVMEFTHPPDFAVPAHVHHASDEAFYILEGAMRGFCGDESWHATPGSLVWLPRGIPHGYAVDGDETLRSLVINMPAGFERFVMESGEPALERTLPPPAAPDVEKLNAAAAKVGIEHLGPPEQ